jgi:hypothetical protein
MVGIAGGNGGPNDGYDPSEFRAEADTNHARALAHYRAGLVVDRISEVAKHAWRQAWLLKAGRLPSERYVCFGD